MYDYDIAYIKCVDSDGIEEELKVDLSKPSEEEKTLDLGELVRKRISENKYIINDDKDECEYILKPSYEKLI